MNTELNIIAHAYSDEKLLPFTFTMYATEEQAAEMARPPYHIPVNLEMVKNYLELDETQLYLYPPRFVYYDPNEECYGYREGELGDFKKWNPKKGPWELGAWQDREYTIPFYDVID